MLEDWGRISVYFIVKEFGGLSEQEMWERVWDYLEEVARSRNGDIGFSVGLSVRDRKQVDQGGIYSIPERLHRRGRTPAGFEAATSDRLVSLVPAAIVRSETRHMDYEIIIGLEIHVQLQTESKMFSWSGTDFGLPPNTQTDPVSLGLPGTLPVMNRKAFDLALKTAVALHAEIAPFTKWDRKNYYYPDLPKNYQISQYDLPFSRGGHLEIPVRKDGGGGGRCHLTRIHLEEDTGKLTHGDGGFSEVDLNRAGIPLFEIVTEPEIRSPADARGCLEELRLTLRYLEVSDCEMQEGSLRCDANVNLHIHKDGQKIATPIVEIKNLNSFRCRRKGLDSRGRTTVQQVARRRQDDQRRPQDDARLERRRRGHQAPAREGNGRRLSLFSRARPGSGRSSTRPGWNASARRSASCPRRAGSGSRPITAFRRTTPTSWSSRARTSPTITMPSPRPPASSSWPATGSSRTCSGPSRRKS